MAIPDQQLETWANPGAEATAAKTYASIQAALSASTSLIRGRRYDVYLQGSYRNSTNIYGDTDVDVVVELEDVFGHNTSSLTETQQAEFNRRYVDATYRFEQFRADVEQSLVAYYDRRLVEPRNKCLQVHASNGRLDADVVPCQTYRVYPSNPNVVLPTPIEGIQFFTRRENRRVVNYPKRHYDNGVAKSSATNGWYKPTVRIFKNLRNYLQAENKIADGDAPSYFVECLLYNVPNEKFTGNYTLCFLNALLWLIEARDKPLFSMLWCGNGVVPLFGTTPEQWTIERAQQFISACLNAWSKW